MSARRCSGMRPSRDSGAGDLGAVQDGPTGAPLMLSARRCASHHGALHGAAEHHALRSAARCRRRPAASSSGLRISAMFSRTSGDRMPEHLRRLAGAASRCPRPSCRYDARTRGLDRDIDPAWRRARPACADTEARPASSQELAHAEIGVDLRELLCRRTSGDTQSRVMPRRMPIGLTFWPMESGLPPSRTVTVMWLLRLTMRVAAVGARGEALQRRVDHDDWLRGPSAVDVGAEVVLGVGDRRSSTFSTSSAPFFGMKRSVRDRVAGGLRRARRRRPAGTSAARSARERQMFP